MACLLDQRIFLRRWATRITPGDPEVQRIIETSIRRIRAAGKAAGFLAVAPDMAQQCLAWGANFVAVGVDTMLYSDALDQRLAMFKSGKNGPRIKGSY